MRFFALLAFSALVSVSHAQTLRIGLAEDPDVLDPSMARTFVGRIVFAGLCDKLFDLDEKLNVVPQLATSYKWSADNKSLEIKLRDGVTFHDGEKMDAQAVKYNLERHKNMKGSNRRGELAVVSSEDAAQTRCAPVRSASSSASRRTASWSSASRTTGTRARSTSSASSTSRSSTPPCASPTCARASSTSSSASRRPTCRT
jgi:peptide/nickel transport system substrate-binding protein